MLPLSTRDCPIITYFFLFSCYTGILFLFPLLAFEGPQLLALTLAILQSPPFCQLLTCCLPVLSGMQHMSAPKTSTPPSPTTPTPTSHIPPIMSASSTPLLEFAPLATSAEKLKVYSSGLAIGEASQWSVASTLLLWVQSQTICHNCDPL